MRPLRLWGMILCLVGCLGACGDAPPETPGEGSAPATSEREVNDTLVFAGQPSEARIGELTAAGFERVVSINPPAKAPSFDEAAAAKGGGLEYKHLAIGKGPLVGDAALRERGYDLFDQVAADGKRTYFHCSSGNRVAALWALYLIERRDRPAAEALTEARRLGLTKAELDEAVCRLLGVAPK